MADSSASSGSITRPSHTRWTACSSAQRSPDSSSAWCDRRRTYDSSPPGWRTRAPRRARSPGLHTRDGPPAAPPSARRTRVRRGAIGGVLTIHLRPDGGLERLVGLDHPAFTHEMDRLQLRPALAGLEFGVVR